VEQQLHVLGKTVELHGIVRFVKRRAGECLPKFDLLLKDLVQRGKLVPGLYVVCCPW